MVPSVKGSIFQSVADDVKRLIERGEITPEEIDQRLSEKDRGLIDQPLTPLSWVPIRSYAGLLDLLAEVEGGDDPRGYLRERGRRAAERLLSGTYEAFAAEPGSWGRRTGATMLGLGQILYNFTRWSFVELPGGVFEISVSDASEFPDAARETAHGFITYYASHASGRKALVESDRSSPDRISFRIQLAPE